MTSSSAPSSAGDTTIKFFSIADLDGPKPVREKEEEVIVLPSSTWSTMELIPIGGQKIFADPTCRLDPVADQFRCVLPGLEGIFRVFTYHIGESNGDALISVPSEGGASVSVNGAPVDAGSLPVRINHGFRIAVGQPDRAYAEYIYFVQGNDLWLLRVERPEVIELPLSGPLIVAGLDLEFPLASRMVQVLPGMEGRCSFISEYFPGGPSKVTLDASNIFRADVYIDSHRVGSRAGVIPISSGTEVAFSCGSSLLPVKCEFEYEGNTPILKIKGGVPGYRTKHPGVIH